jgi:hypothetical protein
VRVGGMLLYGRAGHADMRGSWIGCPRGHYYADPFVIARDGKTWSFFEDFSYSDGRAVIFCASCSLTEAWAQYRHAWRRTTTSPIP